MPRKPAQMTTMTNEKVNPATLWAETLVDALAQSGLRRVVISPGSRSTPLVLAFAAHPTVQHYRCLDERSAGFFALGMALATDEPVALLCTSGTAGANYLPAVIEARMSQVPLLVLTADRPPELRHSGANQTIDQVKLYGDQVLWFADIALPEAEPPAVVRRYLRSTAARALAVANGLPKGPVHLNLPFRKPFEPTGHAGERPGTETTPFIERGLLQPTPAQVSALADLLAAHPRGLIVCGPRCPAGDFPAAVAALSQQTGYPILADALSGVRFGPWVDEAVVCGGYESYLAGNGPNWPEPQLILRFGAVPTSQALNTYLTGRTQAHFVHVRGNGVWADDSHLTGRFLQADEAATCRALVAALPSATERTWEQQIAATEAAYWETFERSLPQSPFFDGVAVADLVASLPAGAILFVANSLPIRHVDQFARPRREPLQVYANRGASGIDGNISTALGMAAVQERPVTLLIGDIAFYHDMNGLLAVRDHALRPTIVLLNNDGGGIFHRLPAAQHDPPFTELFLTPHGLDFEPAAALYGLEYMPVTGREALQAALVRSQEAPAARLIELSSDGREDHRRRRELLAQIAQAM